MNYLKLINWFWKEVPHYEGYRPLYGILFLAIVDGVNKNDWRPNTTIEYDRIINKCKFTKEVYLNGRRWLMSKQLIEFTPGKNNMLIARFSLGPAVGKPTGTPTGEQDKQWEENIPAPLPADLPVCPPIINKQETLNTKHINIAFDNFWNMYDKKVGLKNEVERKWQSLTDTEREKVITHIPLYTKATQEKKFRKDPATYLDKKAWLDEIVQPTHDFQKEILLKKSGEWAQL